MEMKDVTLESQMILSCINRSGQRFGRSIIVDTLRGSKNKKVLGFRLDQLKTYGLMAGHSKESIDLLMNKLIAEGYIHKTEEQYPVLKLTEKSIPLLKNQGTVMMQIVKKQKKTKVEEPLLVELKKLRKEIAVREGFPPYVIFHDAALIEMSSLKPTTLDEFAYIKGVGENKKNKYGAEFLSVIANYVSPDSIVSTQSYAPDPQQELFDEKQYWNMFDDMAGKNETSSVSGFEKQSDTSFINRTEAQNETSTINRTEKQNEMVAINRTEKQYEGDNSNTDAPLYTHYYGGTTAEYNAEQDQSFPQETFETSQIENKPVAKEPTYQKYSKLYLEGIPMEEIADTIGVNPLTVENNLFKAYRDGVDIDLSPFIQEEYIKDVAVILLDDEWDGKLKYIKERLPMEVTYQTIKGVIEKLRRKLIS